ncbi:MAG: enoyl-CoA hydratase/isomerase family protein [Gemmatimonadales bacterium]
MSDAITLDGLPINRLPDTRMDEQSIDSPVLVSRDDAIVTLKLNRPDRMNAVSLDLYRALERNVAEYAADPDVRVLIITGSGRAFCVGADLDAHAQGTGGEEARKAYVGAAQAASRRIQTVPKIVIGAANGHAIGAGLELLLACDLSVVSEAAKFRFPELALGTFVGGGVTRGLIRRVGRMKANELLFLCPMLTGQEAYEAGLVTLAVAEAAVPDTAMQMARTVAGKAPLSVARMKAVLSEAESVGLDDALHLEAEALLACMDTEDWAEGIAAFRDKREPRFRGT